MEGLVGSIRNEMKGTGVKIGIVNPAGIDTEWWSKHNGSNNLDFTKDFIKP